MPSDRPTRLPEPRFQSGDDAILPGTPHVLIVDDNQANRVVIAAFCELFSCTYESARGGLEAIAAAERCPFDLILMDIQMPDMDGIEASERIRALGPPASEVPVIAATSSVEPEAVRSYLASGMCAVVEKPIEPAALLKAMSAALDATNEDFTGWRPRAA